MTVVAWDGHVLAADRQVTQAGLRRSGTKLACVGALRLGCVGSAAYGAALQAWVRAGRKVTDWPKPASHDDADDGTLIVIEEGKVLVYEGQPHPFVIEDTFAAFGSGRDYAMAAMALGQDAQQAVELACRFENGCGMGVDVLTPPAMVEDVDVVAPWAR